MFLRRLNSELPAYTGCLSTPVIFINDLLVGDVQDFGIDCFFIFLILSCGVVAVNSGVLVKYHDVPAYGLFAKFAFANKLDGSNCTLFLAIVLFSPLL